MGAVPAGASLLTAFTSGLQRLVVSSTAVSGLWDRNSVCTRRTGQVEKHGQNQWVVISGQVHWLDSLELLLWWLFLIPQETIGCEKMGCCFWFPRGKTKGREMLRNLLCRIWTPRCCISSSPRSLTTCLWICEWYFNIEITQVVSLRILDPLLLTLGRKNTKNNPHHTHLKKEKKEEEEEERKKKNTGRRSSFLFQGP